MGLDTEDWKEAIRETLVDTYTRIRGETPEGSFVPSSDQVVKLLGMFEGKPDKAVLSWVELCMYAHMMKTQRTRTPFFIQNLLTVKSMDYVDKHRKYLREFYTQNVEPLQFYNFVYGEVFTSENDFLEVIGGLRVRGKSFDWEVINPSVHWVIFSQILGRLDNKLAETWDSNTVEYSEEFMEVLRARSMERKALGDTCRFEEAKAACSAAMRDATLAWASGFGFIQTYVDEQKETVIRPVSEMPLELLEITSPLSKRDTLLFDWAAAKLTERSKAVDLGRKHDVAKHMLENHTFEAQSIGSISPSRAVALLKRADEIEGRD